MIQEVHYSSYYTYSTHPYCIHLVILLDTISSHKHHIHRILIFIFMISNHKCQVALLFHYSFLWLHNITYNTWIFIIPFMIIHKAHYLILIFSTLLFHYTYTILVYKSSPNFLNATNACMLYSYPYGYQHHLLIVTCYCTPSTRVSFIETFPSN